MDFVKDLQPTTDYCYANDPEVTDEKWYPKRRLLRDSVPKTLLCHDYKGNYLDDHYIHGTENHGAYNFYNWACIDIFVYFSHHFVTVPPPSWINAAHENGVPILGTIITEQSNKLWTTILEKETKLQWFADVLSLIAAIHKFDGYLINIENSLPPEIIPHLVTFLKLLKQNLKDRKHTKTYLIWYDAVTVGGSVHYQNELTVSNKTFFDICDGIFLNYNWNREKLRNSKDLAGARAHDVYVGIDVFGRGMIGGGGFNTNMAMEQVRKEDLSAAIFAMGWTEEAIDGDFRMNDTIFWSKLWPYFYVKGTKKLPFSTDFNRGYGTKTYERGRASSDKSWFNLAKQSYQYITHRSNVRPNSDAVKNIISKINNIKYMVHGNPAKEEQIQQLKLMYNEIGKTVLEYTTDEGFSGGGCIKINPSAMEKENKTQVYVTLFICDLEVKRDWAVSVVSKRIFGGNAVTSNKYPYLYVILQTDEKQLVKKKLKDSVNVTNYYKGLSTVGDYYSGFTSYDWVKRKYLVSEKGRILEVGLCVSYDDSEMFLGKIDISEY